MKNFEPLVLNSNEGREPFSTGASEAGFNTSRSNIKNWDSLARKVGQIVITNTGFSTSKSNIKN